VSLAGVNRLFDLANDIERAMASLYDAYSQRCPDAAWRDFWARLRSDETSHAEAIKMQQRLHARGSLPGRPRVEEAALLALLDLLEKERKKAAESPGEAGQLVDDAIRLEEQLYDLHSEGVVEAAGDKSSQEFFKNLAKADLQHVSLLKKAKAAGRPD
jgi:rubrerythrin